MTDNFDKPTVIVTGGSSGLGYAIAERFLAAGNNIVLNGRNETGVRVHFNRATPVESRL